MGQNPIKFGLKTGATFPTMAVSGGNNQQEAAKITVSYYAGAVLNIPISDRFVIQPGVTYIGKGSKSQYSKSSTNETGSVSSMGKSKILPFYLELPLNALFSFETLYGKFFLGGGPYYAFGKSGKQEVSTTKIQDGQKTVIETKNDIKFGEHSDSNLKTEDMGLNFLAGYEFSNGFNFHAGYGFGLQNIASSTFGAQKIKNRVLSVGFGLNF